MLSHFYYRSEPLKMLTLIVLLILWVFSYHHGTPYSDSIFWYLSEKIGVFLFFVLVLFFLDHFIYKYKLTQTHSYALFLFTILLGVFHNILSFNTITISSIVIYLLLNKILGLRNKENISMKLLDAGMLSGVSYLVYPPSFLFILLIYFAYFVYIRIIDKRLIIPILGFLIPIFILYVYYLLFNKLPFFKSAVEVNLNFGNLWMTDLYFSIPFFTLIIINIILILKILSVGIYADLDEERNYKILIPFFIIAMIVALINSKEISRSIVFILFPSVIFTANTVYNFKRNWMKDAVLYFFLLCGILIWFL